MGGDGRDRERGRCLRRWRFGVEHIEGYLRDALVGEPVGDVRVAEQEGAALGKVGGGRCEGPEGGGDILGCPNHMGPNAYEPRTPEAGSPAGNLGAGRRRGDAVDEEPTVRVAEAEAGHGVGG